MLDTGKRNSKEGGLSFGLKKRRLTRVVWTMSWALGVWRRFLLRVFSGKNFSGEIYIYGCLHHLFDI